MQVMRVVVGSPNVGYHWEHQARVHWRQMYDLVGVGCWVTNFALLLLIRHYFFYLSFWMPSKKSAIHP